MLVKFALVTFVSYVAKTYDPFTYCSPLPSTANELQNLNTTPPVRDSGPTPPPQLNTEVSSSLQDSAKKISEMRSLLR